MERTMSLEHRIACLDHQGDIPDIFGAVCVPRRPVQDKFSGALSFVAGQVRAIHYGIFNDALCRALFIGIYIQQPPLLAIRTYRQRIDDIFTFHIRFCGLVLALPLSL